ncbi:MAG TPA: TIR domain-containing protein [Ktedonobacteraceae bacterium]|jgi:hypothetical protein
MNRSKSADTESIDVFCCYARKDRPFLLQLRAHLTLLERTGLLRLWADTDIGAGMEWESEISSHLKTAQIILLLVSSDFIESDYCYGFELQRAMERHARKETRVIPIIVRPTLWHDSPFGKLQALPSDGKPIADWLSQENAFQGIAASIRRIALSLANNRDVTASLPSPPGFSSLPVIASQGRARHWSEHAWFNTRLPIILLLAGLLALILLPASPQRPTVLSLLDIHLDGWLFMRASVAGGAGILETLNPRTGATHVLTATDEPLQQSVAGLGLTNYNDPYYTPQTHQLAFVATDRYSRRGIWSVHLTLKDGWPVMNSLPGALIDPCETTCENSLAWTPDGTWLIFTGQRGIEAVNSATHQKKYLTSQNDKWPACGPDGKWLAYQGAQNVVQALTAINCMPIAQTHELERFISSLSISWFPVWSPDGENLVFKSNSKPGWILYETAFRDLSTSSSLPPVSPIPVGEADCSTMTWAQLQVSGENVQIFVCYNQASPEGSYHLLIKPDGTSPGWQVRISAGPAEWNALDWAPSL